MVGSAIKHHVGLAANLQANLHREFRAVELLHFTMVNGRRGEDGIWLSWGSSAFVWEGFDEI